MPPGGIASESMTEVLLLHHAQGLTAGCLAFADDLRAAGHVVHAPDLFAGRTFTRLADGVAHAEQVGFPAIVERGAAAAAALPPDVVYIGLSLGVMPAQMLAQTRAGARGAVLLHSCVPPAAFGRPWPAGVPVQIHLMDGDELARAPDEDLEAARALAATVEGAELFLYPGDRHLFADASLPDYDEAAATQVLRRVLSFLDAVA